MPYAARYPGDVPRDALLRRFDTVLDGRIRHVRCALEAVHQRHNAGAILRSCDAFGIHTVHWVGLKGDPAWRASRGTSQWVEQRAHDDAEAALTSLDTEGYDVWIADLDANGVPPEEVPLDRPICLWMGAEWVGVSDVARSAAKGVVTLPMFGFTQSLNVSVAAALCLRPLAERARRLGDVAKLRPDERTLAKHLWQRALDDGETD